MEKYTFNKWDYRYMKMAELVGEWSNCNRDDRHVGTVAVFDKRVICTAYNGSPVGVKSCKERGECMRLKLGIKSAKSPEICYSVHSEQALVCNAAKQGLSLQGSTVYCTHQPCVICLKILINAGVARVIYKYEYPDEFSRQIVEEIGFEMIQIDDYPSDETCQNSTEICQDNTEPCQNGSELSQNSVE